MAVRPEVQQKRRETLIALVEDAIRGLSRPLYNHLAKYSALPGPRANEALLMDFAEIVASKGNAADRLITEMVTLDADYALGGTEFEFVPMCGVMAAGKRAASDDKQYGTLLGLLHTASEDLRFRVRDTVPLALSVIGEVRADQLVNDVHSWMDGFFHGAAILRGLGMPGWLNHIAKSDGVVERLDQAFELLRNAPRSAVRYPGFKALLEAFEVTPGVVASRFGRPVFDSLTKWSTTTEPALRSAIEKNLKGTRLAGRHAPDIEAVRAALDASAPPRRDPLTYVGPTRGRGKPRPR